MHIRTFRAASLQDALEQIRSQMGPDASVLHTRQVRDGWMGWLGRTYVEVTAGLNDKQGRAVSPLERPSPLERHSEVDSRSASDSTGIRRTVPVPGRCLRPGPGGRPESQ